MFGIFLNKIRKSRLLFAISLFFLTACSLPAPTESANSTTTKLQTRTEWREALKWPKSCDEGVSHINSDRFVGVEVYAWEKGRQLVSVVCETGAYTRGEMLFLETGKATGQFDLLVFPQFKAISDAPRELNLNNSGENDYYQYSRSLLWGNLMVDNISSKITNDAYYRGGGGCGVSTIYSVFNSTPLVTSLKTQQCVDKDIPVSKWKIQPQSEYSTWPVVTN